MKINNETLKMESSRGTDSGQHRAAPGEMPVVPQLGWRYLLLQVGRGTFEKQSRVNQCGFMKRNLANHTFDHWISTGDNFASTGYIWQCLKTFLVVAAGKGRVYAHMSTTGI